MGKKQASQLGPLRTIARDDLPYFRGVKKFEYKGEEKSPYFVFTKDVILNVLVTKWSLWKYLKGLLFFKFGLDSGYEHVFEKKLFAGYYLGTGELPTSDDEIGEFVLRNKILQNSYGLERGKTKAYIKGAAKGEGYDFVLGEVSDDGKKVAEIYRCKKLGPEQQMPEIIRGLEIDVNCQVIPVGSLESFDA